MSTKQATAAAGAPSPFPTEAEYELALDKLEQAHHATDVLTGRMYRALAGSHPVPTADDIAGLYSFIDALRIDVESLNGFAVDLADLLRDLNDTRRNAANA